MSRLFVLLLAGFAAGFSLAACGPTTTCSAATCGGCCDAMGKCEPGSTLDRCGSGGETCGRCGAGTTCTSGECRAGGTGGGGGGGGSGGGTGGGSGGGSGGGTGGGATGGGGGCRMITMLDTTQGTLDEAEYRSFTSSPGHYNYAKWDFPMAGNPDGFRLEVVYPNDVVPNFPFTQSFTTSTRYASCIACGIFYENCDQNTMICAKVYLAQGGAMTITRADRSSAGRVSGSATNLRFNEWDISNDTSAGSGCVIVNTVGPWNVGWNADGGMPPP